MSKSQPPITTEGERFESPPRALEYPALAIPTPALATPIAAGVTWLRVPLPMELNHINLWLLDDEPGWTLVDTGMAESVCREAWETIDRATLRGRRISRIIITHDHPDHVGLGAWLAQRHDAELWMSAYGHQSMSEYLHAEPAQIATRMGAFLRAHGMPIGADWPPREFDHRRWFGAVPELGRAIAGGDSVRIGDSDWTLIETAGHCGGHLCLHDPQRKLLISGDQVLPQISSNVSVMPSKPEADPLAEFLESLGRVAQCPTDTLVLPSHGKVFHGLQHRIENLNSHHAQQLAAVRAACVEPRTAFEVLPAMFGRALRGFHAVLALSEAIAHLNYLMHRGALRRETDAQGVMRFVVA